MPLNPIQQLNLVTIVSIVVLFVITLLALRRVFFGPLLAVMLARDAKIEKGRQVREEAGRVIADAQLIAETVRNDSAAKKEQAVAAIKADIAAARDELIARATAQADAILAAGLDEVGQMRVTEQAKMRVSLASSVVETLSGLIDTVDERTVRAMVDRQLAEKAVEGPVT